MLTLPPVPFLFLSPTRRSLTGSSTPPKLVKRMLDVENGKLCYIIGTVYMDMTLKPNVLEDLAREVSLRRSFLRFLRRKADQLGYVTALHRRTTTEEEVLLRERRGHARG